MKKYFIAILFILTSTHLSAETLTNQQLLKTCQSTSRDNQNFCYGFIISAANGAQFYRNMVDVNNAYLDICFPQKIANQDLVTLYIQWCKDHPEFSTGPAFVGVSSSFSIKYSCSKQK